MNRRKFIKNTALAGSALLLNAPEARPNFPIPVGFVPKVLATNWGFNGNWEQFAAKAKAAGYDGVEVWAPSEDKNRDEFLAAVQKHGLAFGLLTGGWEADAEKHLAQFDGFVRYALAMKPLYLNCHSGRDYFSTEQAQPFFDLTDKLHRETSIPIYHETHRGRLCFAAHTTRHFLETRPELRLTLDISHWCNVHESLLGDQADTVAIALGRTDHIHARIGHAEGPQVNDPRAPEWASTVQAHFDWWDKVVEAKVRAKQGLTFLTEFGPPHYLPALPYTQQPVADQWGINVHMMELLRSRYTGK